MPRGRRHFFNIVSVSGHLVSVERIISGEAFRLFHSSVCNRTLGACIALAGKMCRFCNKSTGSIPWKKLSTYYISIIVGIWVLKIGYYSKIPKLKLWVRVGLVLFFGLLWWCLFFQVEIFVFLKPKQLSTWKKIGVLTTVLVLEKKIIST